MHSFSHNNLFQSEIERVLYLVLNGSDESVGKKLFVYFGADQNAT